MLTMIPLDRLRLAESNVRRSGSLNLDELAPSILEHGLIQNLTVRPLEGEEGAPAERYEVVAGGRRLRALQQLVKARKLKKGHPVACRVLDGFSATEIGLAENLFQLPMHPHDQYLAFARLSDEGQAVVDIAARFGVSERIVEQRLKLGRVSPTLLALYREARRAWGERVPRDSTALWDWLVAEDAATRQALLAFCLALTVDALVPTRPSSALRLSDPAQVGRLAAALDLDMLR